MYHLVVRQFAFTLRNLENIMGKAQAYAATRKFDVNNFCTMRLFPDMLPFTAQIRIACDHAKNAAAFLSGQEPPKHEDNETTFEELRGRIAKCLAFLDSISAQDFARTTSETVIKLPRPPGKGLRADDYLISPPDAQLLLPRHDRLRPAAFGRCRRGQERLPGSAEPGRRLAGAAGPAGASRRPRGRGWRSAPLPAGHPGRQSRRH